MQRWELASHPFAPQINPTSAALAALSMGGESKPLHERLAEVQRGREERAEELRRRVQAEENATFTPHIDPNSHALAAQQQFELHGSCADVARGNVVERLSTEAALAVERRARREMERQQTERAVCTFRPKVNA